MCLKNERKANIATVMGFCVQIKTQSGWYRGLYHGRPVPIFQKMGAKNLKTEKESAGFYGFRRLKDAKHLAEYEDKSNTVIVKCRFDEVFGIGVSNTWGEEWEENLRAFRARYRTILREIPYPKGE